ncbi:MAG: hypothetical protein [Bacteriophage sp.]|nr:MAG: hypothetical protein [Bacteriophage sp.]
MTNTDKINLCFSVILFIMLFINAYFSKHKANNQIAKTLQALAESFVHSVRQLDVSGQEKMNTVIDAVIAAMKQKGHTVTPEERKAIQGFAQREYDNYINKEQIAKALQQLTDSNSVQAKKSDEPEPAETYEGNDVEDTNNNEIDNMIENQADEIKTAVEKKLKESATASLKAGSQVTTTEQTAGSEGQTVTRRG